MTKPYATKPTMGTVALTLMLNRIIKTKPAIVSRKDRNNAHVYTFLAGLGLLEVSPTGQVVLPIDAIPSEPIAFCHHINYVLEEGE
jgi:hypothetical protein